MEYLAFYITEILLINFIDYKRFHTIINPFFILSASYSLIVFICILFNNKLYFVEFYYPSLLIWSVGLALFWIGGIIIDYLSSLLSRIERMPRYNSTRAYASRIIVSDRLLDVIFCIAIFVLIASFRSAISQDSFGSKDLGMDIGSGGIVGRCSDIALVAFPYYICVKRPRFYNFFVISLLFIYIIALGSKTWSTYAIVCAFFSYQFINHLKLNIKRILVVLLLLSFAFFLYYALTVNAKEFSELIDFTLRHFYFYFTSGTLSLSEYCRLGTILHLPETTHPVIRLVHSWLGDNVYFHSPLFYTTDLIHGTQSNVFTFFGYFVNNSLFSAIILSIMSGSTAYYVFYIFRKNKHNIFAIISYGYTIAVLSFGWFNWGFTFLRIWEIYFLCFIFSIIQYKKRILKSNNITDICPNQSV